MNKDQNDHQDLDRFQLNMGAEQRNAGRDYHENFIPGSIELFLATSTKEALDKRAISNSRTFRHRFGFEPSTPVRRQVIDIQNRLDISDRDIRLLRTAGQLQISRSEAKIVPSRVIPIVGWIYLFLLAMAFGPTTLAAANSTAPAWKAALAVLMALSLWGGCSWLLDRFHLEPWRILKRSGAVAAT